MARLTRIAAEDFSVVTPEVHGDSYADLDKSNDMNQPRRRTIEEFTNDNLYGHYRETQNHDFPEGWLRGRLRDILSPVAKAQRAVKINSARHYRLLTVKLYAKGLSLRSEEPGNRIGVPTLFHTLENDFVVSKIDARNGAWGFVPKELTGGLLSADFPIFRLNDSIADMEYVRYSLSRSSMWEPLRDIAVGTTNRRRIPVEEFLQIPISLPDIDEQHAIARVLRSVQRAKDATENIIAATRELKRSLMRHLFTYGPVPIEESGPARTRETEVGPIPNHWSLARIDSIAKLTSGGTPSKQRLDWWQGPVPWVSPKDMKRPRLKDTQDHISFDAAKLGSRIVPANTILVVVRGMILAKNIPIAITEVPMAINQDMKAIMPYSNISANYLLYALESRRHALVRAIGTSAHGTRRIGTSSIEELLMPIPPLVEQQHIARAIEAVEDKLRVSQNRVQALETLFITLLHDLMTGKVRVPDLGISAVTAEAV